MLVGVFVCLHPQLDLDSINLDRYASEVHNDWVTSLARCERLRSLDLSRCTRVSVHTHTHTHTHTDATRALMGADDLTEAC